MSAERRRRRSSARSSSRNVRSPSPRTMKSTPTPGPRTPPARGSDRSRRRRCATPGWSGADERDQPQRRAALERHDRQADDVGLRARASGARPSRATRRLREDRDRRSRRRWCGSTLPASDASAPFGIRIVTGGVCSNESGIERSRTFIGTPRCPARPRGRAATSRQRPPCYPPTRPADGPNVRCRATGSLATAPAASPRRFAGRRAAADHVEPLGSHRRHTFLLLQDAFDEQERRLDHAIRCAS